MVTLDVQESGVPVTLWSAELEAFSFIPKAWVDSARVETLREKLIERAGPHVRATVALTAKVRRRDCAFRLVQCADWHGDRCVFELAPDGLFLKPKKPGAEEIIYDLLARAAREKLGREVAIPSERVDGFLVQEAISYKGELLDERAAGMILGLIFLLALTDLNAENLRPLDGVPAPVDVECAFDFDFYTHESQAVVVRRLREQARAIEMSFRGMTAPSEQPWVTPGFAEAFAEGAILTRERLRQALDAEIDIDEMHLRRVFLPTRAYLNFIRRRALFGWDDEMATHRWMKLRGSSAIASIVASEVRALSTGNVPFFHQQGSWLRDGADGTPLFELKDPVSVQAAKWVERWSDGRLQELAKAMRDTP